jgi:Ca-activated chloride channel family protein
MIQRQLVFFAMLLTTGPLTASAQEQIFSITTEEVRVEILVTDNGKPIADLGAADFEVFDNGIPQEIQYAKPQQQMPIGAILVFDMSRSVAGELLNHLRDAAKGFLSDLKKEDRVALITFNNAVVLGSPLTREIARIQLALDQAQSFGNSSLIDASYAGLVLATSGVDVELPLLIIFSDGLDTFSWLTAEAVLETAKRNDVVAYAVSTRRLPNKSFLSDLTEFTAGSLFEVEAIEYLPSAFLRILDEFRQRYLVTYIPRGVSESGWHQLDVRVKHRSAKVRVRPGYVRNSPAIGAEDQAPETRPGIQNPQ